MYEGAEIGFHVPATGDIVALLPEILEDSEFEDCSDWHFRVDKVIRVYGYEQNICVLMFPISKTQEESEEKCDQDTVSS